ALEQRRGDLFFQRADLAADRRLRQAKALAGMGEAAGRCDSVEDAKLVPIHVRPPLRSAGPAKSADFAGPRDQTQLSGKSPPCEAARKRSASSAAMQPMPAAVT